MKKKFKLPSKFKSTVEPQLEEFFDAFVVVGYTSGSHQKVMVPHAGKDPACRDGLCIIVTEAQRWCEFDGANPPWLEEGGDSPAR